MLKQTQIYFLVFLVGFQSFGIFALYPVLEGTCKYLAIYEQENHTYLSLVIDHPNDLVWHNGHEVYIDGVLCDVIQLTQSKHGYTLQYFTDNSETEFFAWFEKIGNKIHELIHTAMKHLENVSFSCLTLSFLFKPIQLFGFVNKIKLFNILAKDLYSLTIVSPPPCTIL